MKQKIAKLFVTTGMRFFKHNELQNAWYKVKKPEHNLDGTMGYLAYASILTARQMGMLPHLVDNFGRSNSAALQPDSGRTSFDNEYLNLRLNRIYDLPDVVVDPDRKPTINVLVPAFDFNSISAGFFGVFQMARFLRTTGMNIRLVLFDNFAFGMELFRSKFLDYPGMENLLDELEVSYIGERKEPLRISPDDNCLATVWYSAYFAHKIMKKAGNRPFFYLIQDYETNFFPGGSLFTLADASYDFNYAAVFSTKSLQNLFLERDIGGICSRNLPNIYYNNACSSNLLSREKFIRLNLGKEKKKLVFYSRPIVDRNMFELTALTLITAFRAGIFNPDEWEVIGMGLGEANIELLPGIHSTSLPRMNLAEYMQTVPQFDICLTLMASPHPSLIPMDLAGSGSLVVTNTFYTKKPAYLRSICDNIIPTSPQLDELVSGLKIAVNRVDDLEARHKAATEMKYPREWTETLDSQHTEFFVQNMKKGE